MKGAHQMVGRRLRRRVGAARIVPAVLGEGAFVLQRSVHLVGAHVVEAKGRRALRAGPRRVQQLQRAHHVGAHELARIVDAAVDVRLGREVDDHVGAKVAEDPGYALGIGHVGDLEGEVLGVLDLAQTEQVAGIRQLVEAKKRVLRVAWNERLQEVRADEAGASGDEDPHCGLREFWRIE